jgi:hypothetical protein
MDYLKEEELLTVVSRLYLGDKEKAKIAELCREPLNWDYIIKRAGDEGVDSLLYYHIKRVQGFKESRTQGFATRPLDPLTPQTLSSRYYSNLASNINLLDEFFGVLKRLNKIGIEVIVLKGIFLTEKLYKNIGLRPMTDADVLVRKEAIPEVIKAMPDLGYHITPHGHLGYIKNGNLPAVIDFHWDIWFPEIDDAWKRCNEAMIGDTPARTLDNEDALIYMATHQSINHGMHKLIWLCDIHEFIRAYRDIIEWGDFIRRVKDYNIEFPLYYTLSHTKKLLGADVPSHVLEELKPVKSNSFKAGVFEKTTTNHYTVDVGHLLYLILLKGFRKKASYLFHYIFPQRDFMIKRYSLSSGRNSYLYYIVRPILLFIQGIKGVYQIIF